MACSHISSSTKVWLPRLDNHIVVPHPYCKDCGTVKNISSDKARGLGYYLNVLQEIKRHLERRGGKLTQVQTRLIAKEFQKSDKFQDTYGVKGTTQRSAFIGAVIKYTNFSSAMAEAFF